MDVLLFESLGIGAILGLLLGLTGAGGSLVALPLLLSLHLPLRDAIGVSLGAVALSALIGAIPRARQGQVAWRPVLVLALAGLPSNAVGQWLGRFVPEGVLIVAFCLLVLWSAWRMWRGAGMKREASDQARSLPLLGIGLAVGLLSGLMGVGGGFLVVPGLLWFTPLSMMAATATSMAVIALVSGGGFLIYLTGAHPPLPLLGGLAAGGAVGVLGGNLLAQRLGGPTLQRLFALMLVAVSFSLAAQKLYGGELFSAAGAPGERRYAPHAKVTPWRTTRLSTRHRQVRQVKTADATVFRSEPGALTLLRRPLPASRTGRPRAAARPAGRGAPTRATRRSARSRTPAIAAAPPPGLRGRPGRGAARTCAGPVRRADDRAGRVLRGGRARRRAMPGTG